MSVHVLNKERDERGAKGKAESSSQVEKLERNVQKLASARNDYTAHTSSLMADLNNAWNSRIAVLGPALASFAQAEKHFLELFAQEISTITASDRLTSVPPSQIPSTIAPSDIPTPAIAGDLKAKPPVSTEIDDRKEGVAEGIVSSSIISSNPFESQQPMQQPTYGQPMQQTTYAQPIQQPIQSSPPVVSSQISQQQVPYTSPVPTSSVIDTGVSTALITAPTPLAVQPQQDQFGLSSVNDQPSTRHAVAPGGMLSGEAVPQPASTIIVDPTPVLQQQASYTVSNAGSLVEPPKSFDIPTEQNRFTSIGLKQGEEESKRQRYEDEQKQHVAAGGQF